MFNARDRDIIVYIITNFLDRKSVLKFTSTSKLMYHYRYLFFDQYAINFKKISEMDNRSNHEITSKLGNLHKKKKNKNKPKVQTRKFYHTQEYYTFINKIKIIENIGYHQLYKDDNQGSNQSINNWKFNHLKNISLKDQNLPYFMHFSNKITDLTICRCKKTDITWPKNLINFTCDNNMHHFFDTFPDSVQSIRIGNYSGSIHHFPKNLKHLKIDLYNVPSFPITKLPYGLISIKLTSSPPVSIDNLPDTVEKIDINQYCTPIKKYPKNLKRIKFHHFNDAVDNLPYGIEEITFGWKFDKPIDKLPITIKKIHFTYNFCATKNKYHIRCHDAIIDFNGRTYDKIPYLNRYFNRPNCGVYFDHYYAAILCCILLVFALIIPLKSLISLLNSSS